ncbi:MAG: hypothetical protein IKT39_02445 [Clostridia bacterium]|nr:hypothetical protein [Clostridia bacterium]
MGNLIKRSDKKAFYGVLGDAGPVFTRMRYFTEISISKNPVEYSRQYVDEAMERTDVVGYSPSMSFGFDDYTEDAVLADIVGIINDEKLGTDAQRDIVMVDFARPSGAGFEATKRTFAVIADAEGDGTEAYTYSGNLKVVSSIVKGVASIATPEDGDSDSVETITFTETEEVAE